MQKIKFINNYNDSVVAFEYNATKYAAFIKFVDKCDNLLFNGRGTLSSPTFFADITAHEVKGLMERGSLKDIQLYIDDQIIETLKTMRANEQISQEDFLELSRHFLNIRLVSRH